MKKIILSVFVIGALLSSCTNNGNKAETADAKKVQVVKTDETVSYNIIKDGSFIDWKASHLGGVQPRSGKIFMSEASVLVTNDVLTGANATIDMPSLTVESFPEGAEEKGKLEGHLLSADFFEVDKFPTALFELTSIESVEGEFNSKVTGNLMILGVSKNISFNANVNITKEEVAIKSENFSIDRRDWGLTYNVEGTEGVPVDYLIANDIGFTINLNLKK